MVVKRTYIIPLRKEFQKAPMMRKAKKAVTALREFLVKHMKSDHVLIGKYLNEKIWERGIRNPIHKVSVDVIKEDDGTVKAELTGHKWIEPIKPKAKEEKKSGLAGKLQGLKGGEEEKPKISDQPKEETKEKPAEKTEVPEPKKEIPKTEAKPALKEVKPEIKTEKKIESSIKN